MSHRARAAVTMRRPNFLIIIADDLGFSDIGCYGAEIKTPNIDALSQDGVRMLQYHTASACSPTRAMVLTGTDAHVGGLGCLIEFKHSEHGKQRWAGKAGYEGYLNHSVATLPEILEDNGYQTILSGKWHLGMQQEHGPWARGFQKSFTMLPGCCNHFGWEPVPLANGMSGQTLGGRPIHAEDGAFVRVEPNKTEDPQGFYSSRTYSDRMIDYLDKRDADKPWFGYLAYTAPHWPIQAHKETVKKYTGIYADGPYALRKRRLARLAELGIISPDVIAHDVVHDVPHWDELSEYERQCSARVMETYAAMVEEMDEGIGRVITHLKEIGEYDNTFIIFMSDNGAEGAAYEAEPIHGKKHVENINKYNDNSLDNIGRWNSYTWLGPLWAQASTAPSRLYKMFTSEGGILVPAVIKPPNVMPNWTPGSFNRCFTTCMDLAPTFLDLAGVTLPVAKDFAHRGRTVHRMTGHSWIPFFSKRQNDDTWAIYPSDKAIGWELRERAGLRKGKWKISHFERRFSGKSETPEDDGWELFDVEADPGETKDLAAEHPEVLQELLRDWEEYVRDFGIVWGANAMDEGLSPEEAPHLHPNDREWERAWLMSPPGTLHPVT